MWIQGEDDRRPDLEPFRVQVKVEGRGAVELFRDPTYKLEVGAQLTESTEDRAVVLRLLHPIQESLYAAVQSLHAVEEGVGLRGSLGVRCEGNQLGYVAF